MACTGRVTANEGASEWLDKKEVGGDPTPKDMGGGVLSVGGIRALLSDRTPPPAYRPTFPTSKLKGARRMISSVAGQQLDTRPKLLINI